MNYETPADLANEQRFADLLRRDFSYEVFKLPPHHPIDFMIKKPGMYPVFCEYKRRNYLASQFDTIYFPADKFISCRLWSTLLPVYIVMEWDDQITYCNINNVLPSVAFAGRPDRGEGGYTAMVQISAAEFAQMSVKNT